MREYIHPLLDEAITAIGGHYVFTGEKRIRCRGREVLYLTGYAILDSSCCGVGGTVFAFVPGIVQAWKCRRTADGRMVSRVVPVSSEPLQREIRRQIRQLESIYQVNFDS